METNVLNIFCREEDGSVSVRGGGGGGGEVNDSVLGVGNGLFVTMLRHCGHALHSPW